MEWPPCRAESGPTRRVAPNSSASQREYRRQSSFSEDRDPLWNRRPPNHPPSVLRDVSHFGPKLGSGTLGTVLGLMTVAHDQPWRECREQLRRLAESYTGPLAPFCINCRCGAETVSPAEPQAPAPVLPSPVPKGTALGPGQLAQIADDGRQVPCHRSWVTASLRDHGIDLG